MMRTRFFFNVGYKDFQHYDEEADADLTTGDNANDIDDDVVILIVS